MNEDLKKGNKSAENRIESIRPATLKEILAIPVVKKYIETAISKAREDGIKSVNLPVHDHSKCPLPQSCIGYMNAESDLEHIKEELLTQKK